MHTTEINLTSGRTVTIRRPAFSTMTNAAAEYERLLDLDTPGAILADPGFERMLIKAFAHAEDFDEFKAEADHEEAWELWLAYADYSRFEEFLGNASEALMERKLNTMKRRMDSQNKHIETMKAFGLVPADFSIKDAVQKQMATVGVDIAGGFPTPNANAQPDAETTSTAPSSTTTSRASTGGSRAKSTKKTTGS